MVGGIGVGLAGVALVETMGETGARLGPPGMAVFAPCSVLGSSVAPEQAASRNKPRATAHPPILFSSLCFRIRTSQTSPRRGLAKV